MNWKESHPAEGERRDLAWRADVFGTSPTGDGHLDDTATFREAMRFMELLRIDLIILL